jgi:hypothetical protein
MRWNGRHWLLRDLGSRNGTFVDGRRIAPGEEHPLRAGEVISFGRVGQMDRELVDDGPPGVMAVPVDGGAPMVMEGDLLAIPSESEPEVSVFRTAEGWALEHGDATILITNLQVFEAAGRTWRFHCPEPVLETAAATANPGMNIRHLQLTLSVSRDEEFVSLRMASGVRSVDMGSRNHNYLLLTLARQRLGDVANGLPESSCGWVYQDDIVSGADIEGPSINLDVFRIRKQFGALGIPDAAQIIERRPRTRQLRIGTSRVTVVRL